MCFEIQIWHFNLKPHFQKYALRFKHDIWVSNHIYKYCIWVSGDIFKSIIWDSSMVVLESQMTFSTMCFEIQIWYLSLNWHVQKCTLRFRYSILSPKWHFQKVIWNWNPVFESQMQDLHLDCSLFCTLLIGWRGPKYVRESTGQYTLFDSRAKREYIQIG